MWGEPPGRREDGVVPPTPWLSCTRDKCHASQTEREEGRGGRRAGGRGREGGKGCMQISRTPLEARGKSNQPQFSDNAQRSKIRTKKNQNAKIRLKKTHSLVRVRMMKMVMVRGWLLSKNLLGEMISQDQNEKGVGKKKRTEKNEARHYC